MLGIGVDTFDRYVRPDLSVVYVGGARLYRVDELERWLDKNAVAPDHARRTARPRPMGPTE
jgi:hypothetical protein